MLPKIAKKLPRTLKIKKEIYESLKKVGSGYWFISWLGRSFYKESRIHREFYITLCTNEYYVFKNSTTFCIDFPEEYSIRYKQGNYYKYDGTFIKSAHDDDKTKILEDVLLSREKHAKILNLSNILSKSYYPTYKKNNSNSKFLDPYEDVPCYEIEVNEKKYIIPLNVVQSYFYATSSLSIYYLIYGILREGLILPNYYDDQIIVPYRRSLINKNEAYFFSKFYFLVNNDFDALYRINEVFQKNLINNQKKFLPLKSYIMYGFPFHKNQRLKINLHYQPIDREGKINMVYNISDLRLVNNEQLFNTSDYLLHDIEESIRNENQDDYLPGNVQMINIKNDDPIIVMGSPDNNNNVITNISIEDNTPRFTDSPQVKDFDEKLVRDAYDFVKQYINHIKKYDIDVLGHNATSDTGVANLNLDGIDGTDYMEIIFETFELLQQNENFDCNYIFLRRYKNTLFSYDPVDLEENGSLLLFQISYNLEYYCVIVRPNRINRIGILKRETMFDTKNDTDLTKGLSYIARRYDYNWSKLKTINDALLLSKYNFIVVNALNKTKGKTPQERIDSLYERISNTIISRTSKESNN